MNWRCCMKAALKRSSTSLNVVVSIRPGFVQFVEARALRCLPHTDWKAQQVFAGRWLCREHSTVQIEQPDRAAWVMYGLHRLLQKVGLPRAIQRGLRDGA